MFPRARRRLTLLYVALFAIVLAVFSVVFYLVMSIALAPAFDVAPEPPTLAAAERAYGTAIERIAIALIAADVVVVVLVGLAAWFLAGRTLRPVRDAHDRQRRFAADASHEIRSPLAVVRSAAERAVELPSGDPGRDAALREIVDASERLARLTDDLLVLSRTESGEQLTGTEELDLSVHVSEAIDRLLVAQDGPHASLSRRLAPDLVVRVDPRSLERVVSNLVDNALRYVPLNGNVRVTTRAVGDMAAFEVTDDGPGIAAADSERVFEPFYRVRSDVGAPPGNGLGLAISRALAGRAGGRIELDSAPGRGSTFRMTLPRRRV